MCGEGENKALVAGCPAGPAEHTAWPRIACLSSALTFLALRHFTKVTDLIVGVLAAARSGWKRQLDLYNAASSTSGGKKLGSRAGSRSAGGVSARRGRARRQVELGGREWQINAGAVSEGGCMDRWQNAEAQVNRLQYRQKSEQQAERATAERGSVYRGGGAARGAKAVGRTQHQARNTALQREGRVSAQKAACSREPHQLARTQKRRGAAATLTRPPPLSAASGPPSPP